MKTSVRHNPFANFYLTLSFILLIEGFVSIAIEILTIRQLLPFAGGSVVVTSLIIGLFLLFLALGYHRGGTINDNQKKVLKNNFLIAALCLGIGLSYIFVNNFFYYLQKITGDHILTPLIIYLLCIIAPLVYVLGQTIPITMNMVRVNYSAGKLGGMALALNTVGSFLGAVMTTLIFMYYFGVAQTIFINFLLLILIHLMLIDSGQKLIIQTFLFIPIVLSIYYLNILMEDKYFVLTNDYANYQIQDSSNFNLLGEQKVLIINNGLSSYLDAKNKGFEYIESIKKILFNDLNIQNEEILVLGAGGFSISAETTHNNHFTYVDIDPQIKTVVKPRFIKEPNGDFLADDARHYLQSTKALYKAIVTDTYTDRKAIPAHLLTREFMQAVKNRLKENGIAIFNIVASPALSDPYSKHIDNTIRSVFNSCMVVPLAVSIDPTNIIYACIVNKRSADRQVYSDNLNNSTNEAFTW